MTGPYVVPSRPTLSDYNERSLAFTQHYFAVSVHVDLVMILMSNYLQNHQTLDFINHDVDASLSNHICCVTQLRNQAHD